MGVLFGISIVCQLFCCIFLVGFWILVFLVFGGWLFLTGGAAFLVVLLVFCFLFESFWAFCKIFWFFVESLILAQDERWRRA